MKIFLASLTSLLLSMMLLLLLLTHHQLGELKARGELMLCLKESKGELHQFITHIEKINLAIVYLDKGKYLILIPGLAAVATNTERAKKIIQKYQDLKLGQHLIQMTRLHKRCPQAPQTFLTPYQIGALGFKRHFNGTTIWRKKWSTYTRGRKEVASIFIKEKNTMRLKPKITYQFSIKKANAWSLLPSSLGSSPSVSQVSSL